MPKKVNDLRVENNPKSNYEKQSYLKKVHAQYGPKAEAQPPV
jgi:hypothetical protein